jgi:hypothetical protein
VPCGLPGLILVAVAIGEGSGVGKEDVKRGEGERDDGDLSEVRAPKYASSAFLHACHRCSTICEFL